MPKKRSDDQDDGKQGRSEPNDGRSRRAVLYGVGALGTAGFLGETGRASGSTGQARAESTTRKASADQLPKGLFEQVQQLLAEDGEEGDDFGFSVALTRDIALIGAPGDSNENGLNTGAAYVFTRKCSDWVQTQKLLADDGEQNDDFGFSVALTGDVALVGAPADNNQNGENAGAAYVFAHKCSEWTQTQKLLADDGEEEDSFGFSVSLDDDTALIGAPAPEPEEEDPNAFNEGAAYVFTRKGKEWAQRQKLLADDGEEGNSFGFSVALNGDVALVGASTDDNENGPNAGAAYVFTREDEKWAQRQNLIGDESEDGDFFGFSVALGEDTAFVGAPFDDNENDELAGSVFVFTRVDGKWTRTQKLLADDGDFEDFFGNSIALNGDTALIGSFGDDIEFFDVGSAYVFTREHDGWTQVQKLLAGEVGADDLFGNSVALDDDTALVGVPFDDNENGESAGSAYAFERQPATDGH